MIWQRVTGGYVCPEQNATIMKYEDGKTAFIVNWTRKTTSGGEEQNNFYCDSLEQAEDFKKALEESNNGKANFISQITI